MLSSSPYYEFHKELGSIVRALRKNRNLTGGQLGEKASLSQSKISKFEHGYPPLPEHEKVWNILDILHADKKTKQKVQLLLAQVEQNQPSGVTYRSELPFGTFLELERQATSIKVYTHNVIPALLQTSEYRRTLLLQAGIPKKRFPSIMHETLLRQDLLWKERRRQVLLMDEAALYTLVATPKVQLVQLDRLERLTQATSCEVGIIPTNVGLTVFELPNFNMCDDKKLFMSTGLHEIELQEAAIITHFIYAFGELYNKAHFKDEAISLVRKASDYFRR